MRNAVIYSGLLHVVLVTLVITGLPSLMDPFPETQIVPVELVTLDEDAPIKEPEPEPEPKAEEPAPEPEPQAEEEPPPPTPERSRRGCDVSSASPPRQRHLGSP